MKELEAEGIPFLFIPIILECELDENIKRAKADNRDFQRIEYGIKNTRELYKQYDYPRIDVTNLTVDETVDKLIELINAV
jgi:regulator of PEP synthase PpsR (kinase-PPPase family)